MNSSTVPPIATPEVPQELEWLLDPKPKRCHVLATAWLTKTNGEEVEVPCTLNYGEFDTIKEAQAQIKDLQTDCSLLLKAGVHPKVVADRLGHSSIKETLDTYSHVAPGMQREASDKLDTMLFDKTEGI